AQIEGDNELLNGIYYYNPDIKSIKKYANLLRSDLGLSKIKDKDEFLNERVIKQYGELLPLTPIDDSLLRDNQKDTTEDEESDDQSQDEQSNNNQQYDNSGNEQWNNQQNPNNGFNQNQNPGNQQNPNMNNNPAQQQAPSGQDFY
ncbi:LytR family transcriptional regulator, partial [Staphylococcus simulans]